MTDSRRAARSDAEAIAALNARAWHATYRGLIPDAFLNSLDAAQTVEPLREALADPRADVLVIGNPILGFGLLAPSRDADADAGTGEIVAIYVDPDHWRSGLGTELLGNLLGAAAARGYAEVTLWVLADNHRARAFYEARGLQGGIEKSEEKWGSVVREVRYRRPIHR